jgi:hypothetical protein
MKKATIYTSTIGTKDMAANQQASGTSSAAKPDSRYKNAYEAKLTLIVAAAQNRTKTSGA